ncbi:tRNA (adenosine(37)-N6)-dimethylallyltransferase MiaA [bacterium]|nr:tRNA (adenosine(37)-N6)-dimethylallyltransferase MiaA [bacterium]
MVKKKVVVIIGPTASGKTSMAVDLASNINGEIISADSRQVYREMDIGTGKDLEEYGSIPYHLIDIVDAGDEFTVSDFQILAHAALKKISSKECTPIICGGTCHYVKALLEDYTFNNIKSNRDFTEKLELLDRQTLYRHLKDYGLWESHHWESDSRRRIVRAIEKKTNEIDRKNQIFDFKGQYITRIYCPEVERPILKTKIRDRLLLRLNQGMIEEVDALLKRGVSHERLERYGLEYKWISRFLRDLITKTDLIEKLQVEIARYAKRQMTFIRYMKRCGHPIIPVSKTEELVADAKNWLLK